MLKKCSGTRNENACASIAKKGNNNSEPKGEELTRPTPSIRDAPQKFT